ncbi:MAG: hypothetical protein E4H13_11045, partial [Calditrichales bacterium]
MNSRERVLTAIQHGQPDRVPVWCLLSLGHIVRNGTKDQKVPETIEELVEAECALVTRYNFDGTLVYFPGTKKGARVGDFVRKSIETLPEGDASHDFESADPEKWMGNIPDYHDEDFFSSHYTREILGESMHIGGWAADGFSKAIQWFPTFDEAMMASILDPVKFRAMVDFFDQECIAWAKAQIELGKLESIQISSPYAGSSLISVAAYRNLVLNSVTTLAKAIRSVGGFSYLHTCGFIADRIRIFLETKVDGIECMDPPPLGDMNLMEAKRQIGSKLFLKGNIDSVNILLRGQDQEVDRIIRETLSAGMAGGGYILSTACSVAPDVTAQRVHRLWEL